MAKRSLRMEVHAGRDLDDEDGGDEEVDGGPEGGPPPGVGDVVSSFWNMSLRPCPAYPTTSSQTDAVTPVTASTTKTAATAISTAMTGVLPSAMAKPT